MTERLYHRDAYRKHFRGIIRQKNNHQEKIAVELDQTCFYPTSGGQPWDRGELNGVQVVEVVEQGGRVLHLLQEDGLEVGKRVEGKIDWRRRFDHMQQHTGQHLLSQAFLRTLQTETVSFHLGGEVSTIDLSRERLESEEIYQVEDLCNQIIFENRPIRIHFVDRDDQSQLSLRKTSSRSGTLRIIEIADFDYSPCGGTHLRQTGELGLVKIRRWVRVKKRARVEFYCGWRALKDYRWKNRAVYRFSCLYSSLDREVVTAAEEHLAQESSQRKTIAEMQAKLLDFKAHELFQKSQARGEVQVVCEILPERELATVKELARRIAQGGEKRLVLLGVEAERPVLLFARSSDLSYDMGEWISQVSHFIEGKGGGNPIQAQAGGGRREGLPQALQWVLDLL